jgi:molybdopterin molybdotransferase
MISSAEALKQILDCARLLPTERVSLRNACGRVLAQDVASDVDMPPFNKSAMDGFACRREDLPGPLRVLETVQAGALPTRPVGKGECTKIMTGARVPDGADCVIMVEHTEAEGNGNIRFMKAATDANVCLQGEDVRAGDVLLRRGIRLEPRHIAVLAAVGCVEPEVACLPRVGIITTGNELVEPTAVPGPSQIRNTNGWQLRAQVEQTGALVNYYGIVPDVETELDSALKRAIKENDVVLLSGGVSMGDYDFVPGIMTRNSIRILFDSISMKPGKPTTFGVGSSVYCFGLPGNPVSAFLQCETLVKPFLFALMGHAFRPLWISLPLANTYTRKKADREAWIPVLRTPEGAVKPKTYHGSAHIAALANVYGFMVIPQSVTTIEKAAAVNVWTL